MRLLRLAVGRLFAARPRAQAPAQVDGQGEAQGGGPRCILGAGAHRLTEDLARFEGTGCTCNGAAWAHLFDVTTCTCSEAAQDTHFDVTRCTCSKAARAHDLT